MPPLASYRRLLHLAGPHYVLVAFLGRLPLSMSQIGTLLLVDSVLALVLAVLLLGFKVTPYMIGVFSIGERAVPPARVGLAMTLLARATGIGYAVGSTVAGRLADTDGYSAAFTVTVAATILALVLAVSGQRPAHRMLAARAQGQAGGSTSSRLTTLPVALRGRSSSRVTSRGTL